MAFSTMRPSTHQPIAGSASIVVIHKMAHFLLRRKRCRIFLKSALNRHRENATRHIERLKNAPSCGN
jgi:hypothetical protein